MPPTWDNETGFRKALEHTLGFEGGFSDHPLDRGGRTNFGITEDTWFAFCRSVGRAPIPPIDRITKDDAGQVYCANYWNKLRCSEFNSLHVALELFDTGVNMGVQTAGILAQRAYNFLRLENYPPLFVDGILGPKSISAINKLTTSYENAYILALNGEQYIRYKDIVESNPTQRAFARGWVRRTAILEP